MSEEGGSREECAVNRLGESEELRMPKAVRALGLGEKEEKKSGVFRGNITVQRLMT